MISRIKSESLSVTMVSVVWPAARIDKFDRYRTLKKYIYTDGFDFRFTCAYTDVLRSTTLYNADCNYSSAFFEVERSIETHAMTYEPQQYNKALAFRLVYNRNL